MLGQARKHTTVHQMRGFTLIELMITVAVMAILVILAVPNFRNMILSNALTTAANDIVGALNLAKLDAIKRNAPAQFCSNDAATNTTDTLGTACGTTAGGVVVLTTSTTTSPVRGASPSIQGSVQLHGNIAAVRFGGSGIGYTPGTTTPYNGSVVDVCATGLSTNNHRVVSLTTGSVISSSITTGTCP
jgi:type IV fimbrial biogenesis protein FimT